MLEIPIGKLPDTKTTVLCYDVIENPTSGELELMLKSETIEFEPSEITQEELERAKRLKITNILGIRFHVELEAIKRSYGDYPFIATFKSKVLKISSLKNSHVGDRNSFILAGASVEN